MMTLSQLVAVTDLVWLRVYPGGPAAEYLTYNGPYEIRDAIRAHGNRTVSRILPGYRFLIVYLAR